MAVFTSEYLRVEDEFVDKGVFDSIIDTDSNFFINLIRLKETQVPEFRHSYASINNLFSSIATLLQASDKKGDKFYKAAFRLFDFSEVNGINLGYSESKYGSGFGKKLRNQVMNDAFDIIKKGSFQPEIFQLVGLFEENIGPDRLSDMVATIIFPDIVQFTKRINQELNIVPESYPEFQFSNGLVRNPYKNCDILLLPIDILQELPIAKCWEDIDRVIGENESIRREVNVEVGLEWQKWASGQKKNYLKEQVFKDPKRCFRVIEAYRDMTAPPVDLSSDLGYFVEMLFKQMKKTDVSFFVEQIETKTTIQAAEEVLMIFKNWVENNKGWDTILEAESAKREKIVQRLVHLSAKHYIQLNNLDISFESDAGRGPADFKVSRGSDITVGEIKLSSNGQYLHGYTVQLEQYAIAEGTKHKIFIFVDIGNPGRLKKIIAEHEKRSESDDNAPILVIIDSKSKAAASSYS
jgi:hypothetical protein